MKNHRRKSQSKEATVIKNFPLGNKLVTTVVLPVTPDILQDEIFVDDAQYLQSAYLDLKH